MSEENKEKLKAEIDRTISEVANVLESCTPDECSVMIKYISKTWWNVLRKYSPTMADASRRNIAAGRRAAELSPKSKPARSRNMDTARLSRLSAMIVKKLGREPRPCDNVVLGAKSYIFGGGETGETVVSVFTNGNVQERAFTWENGRLTRKNLE